MVILSSFATDTGRKRKANEDSVLANDWLGLYLVADGMGGHSCGDVASQTVLEVMRAKIEIDQKKGLLEDETTALKSFTDAIRLGNRAVWELSAKMTKCRAMGTTLVGALICNDILHVANVGDSRIYRLRGGTIEQITRDHSLVEDEIELGVLTREEARTSPKRNIITRAMGLKEEVKIDTQVHDIVGEDFLLICSDGLTGMVEDSEILKVVTASGENLNKATAELIEHANLNGGDDNITIILLHFKDE
jgi:protein phosphatase